VCLLTVNCLICKRHSVSILISLPNKEKSSSYDFSSVGPKSRTFIIYSMKTFLPGCCLLTPVILATWEAEIRAIEVCQPGQILQDSISKITTAKWTGGAAQVVKCLFCKYKVLSSNTSPIKKN
jgi:hypothetical protein